MDRITDRPDMTSAVDRGRKALTQQQYVYANKVVQNNILLLLHYFLCAFISV